MRTRRFDRSGTVAAREAVRTAAANVASQARLEELCPDGTPPDTCDRRLRQAAGSS